MNFIQPRTVVIGGMGNTRRIEIGGNAPVSIQTMWKEGILPVLTDKNALISITEKIEKLQALGCDIIRFAVPDMESAKALCIIADNTTMPLVADIHFDYRLALECLKGNVAKIRINPGNIGSFENSKKVVDACKDKGTAIRIGVNTGSLPKDLLNQVLEGSISRGEALAQTAFREVSVFDELNFSNVVVSMKASSVKETIEANEAFASKFDIPLHIGVTEAGPVIGSVVKSTMALGHLLLEDIGSTIRVSISDTPESEVIAAKEILKETGKRTGGVNLISCPRCGRVGFDVHGFVARWQERLLSMDKNITVAVMGCVVNGPGEGKHADLGIAGAGDSVIIFRKGKIVQTVSKENADNAFIEELKLL